ncbi:MAG TPA: phosphoribosylformylglycinamidine synthase subunit PurQ [Candidatus Saccharimonadales bacterium]|nr:phosphoribosylformylglycinamidine synthase subunit PurQ [Candidatus Saccharimonadales bacterium]
MKPKVLIFSGYGINSEEETKFAFDLAGGESDIVHINDLIEKKEMLHQYNILAFPGGFAYGDDTGAGNAYAQKIRNHLWETLQEYIQKDTLIIGICNGFQILVNLGLLPALEMQYGERELGLMPNDIPRYTVRFVDLYLEQNKSPWLKNIKTLSIPVSNGEGKLYASKETLEKMKKKKVIALKYREGEMCRYLDLPASPNGSIDGIAGITDESGKILGLMPHPERAMFFTQLPNWPLLKEQHLRKNEVIPYEGPGLQIFKNAISYFN